MVGGRTLEAAAVFVDVPEEDRAQAILALALVSVFLNPVMLSTGVDRPLALFTYLLVMTGGASRMEGAEELAEHIGQAQQDQPGMHHEFLFIFRWVARGAAQGKYPGKGSDRIAPDPVLA